MVISEEAARNVVGIVGNVISFVLFISQLITILKIVRRRAVEEFKPNDYLGTVMNCLLWVFFGMPFVQPDSLLLVTINSVGLVLGLGYLVIFFIYAPNNERKKVACLLCVEVVFYATVILVTMLAFHNTENRSLFVGILCDIFNSIMQSFGLLKVIRTRSVEYMSFAVSLANFLNGGVWIAYARIYKPDIYVLVSNSFGAFCGAIQLITYARYYSTTPESRVTSQLKYSSLTGIMLLIESKFCYVFM